MSNEQGSMDTGEAVDPQWSDTDNEPKIIRVNFDAQQGNTEIWVTMPNVAMLAAECTELLKVHDAKNYVQFDMIPRAELEVPGYRVTVQRIDGKSPAQRVIEMEKQVDEQRNTIATQAAQVAKLEETLQFASTYRGYEARPCPLCKYKNGKFIEHCQMHKDMRAQAARIGELERELAAQTSKFEAAFESATILGGRLEQAREAMAYYDIYEDGDDDLATIS